MIFHDIEYIILEKCEKQLEILMDSLGPLFGIFIRKEASRIPPDSGTERFHGRYALF